MTADALKLADLIADTANEMDQLFRQRHKMADVEHLLAHFAKQVSSAPKGSSCPCCGSDLTDVQGWEGVGRVERCQRCNKVMMIYR